MGKGHPHSSGAWRNSLTHQLQGADTLMDGPGQAHHGVGVTEEGKRQAGSRQEQGSAPGVGQRPPRDEAMDQPAKAFPAATWRQKQPPNWPVPQPPPMAALGWLCTHLPSV